MTLEEFEQVVAEEFAKVPAKFIGKIKNVAILVDDQPSLEARKQQGLQRGETLLGLYHGIPHTARGASYGVGPTLPDTITLFRLPILEEAGANPARIRAVIRDTIWHEVAHYFGMDEGMVDRREAEGTNLY